MLESMYGVSKKDLNNRKIWVGLLAVDRLAMPAFHFLLTFFGWVNEEMSYIILEMIFGLVGFSLFYYCAYLKHGNKLLIFSMFILPILILSSIRSFISGHYNNILLAYLIVTFNITWIGILIFYSYKLLMLNYKLKFHKKFPQDYESCVREMLEAPSIEVLETTYERNKQQWPEHQKLFQDLYNTRNLEFKFNKEISSAT